MKQDFNDIAMLIDEKVNSSVGKAVLSAVTAGSSIYHPELAIVVSAVAPTIGSWNKIKLSCLIQGLSSGLDVERQINNYIALWNSQHRML